MTCTTRNFIEKLHLLGGLHDAVVHRLTWTPEAKIIEFEIEDFYCNFDGLPEYPGRKSGSLIFEGIEHVHFDVETNEKRLNVDDLSISEVQGGEFVVAVTFWPYGRITAQFRSMGCPGLS